MQMMQRTMTAGSFSGGGALIDSELRTADMIELLRNKALVSQMGARTLSGLVGNIAIPRVTGGATAYWLPESGTVNASDQSFGQLGLVPHRLVGDTGYSKELLMQSSADVEGFVREDLMRVLALEKDRVAITGLGAAGEPRGIMNTTGVGSVTFGAAPTWAKGVGVSDDPQSQGCLENRSESGRSGNLPLERRRGKRLSGLCHQTGSR